MLAGLTALSPAIASEAKSVGTYRYTPVHFTNAPEAIGRVLNVKKLYSEKILLTLISCLGKHATPAVVIVLNAQHANFVPGRYIITGVMSVKNVPTLVIRTLSEPEARLGGCIR